MSNIDKEIIEVYWTQLRGPTTYESMKRDCPFCEDGLLLATRDRGTLELEEVDGCVGCGQRVR